MTVDEIFKKLASHMRKGMMIHQDLANYYDFLNLCGYKKCHEYHYLDENCGYKKLCHYYISHFNKLIEKEEDKKQNIIPASWYQHSKQDVDTQTKRQAVQTAMEIWVNWEKQTKLFYQNMYTELIAQKEVAAALFLQEYICNVTDELKCAEKKMLDIKATNFDIYSLVGCQKEKHKKYKKKIKHFFDDL